MSKIIRNKANLLFDTKATLGEGPVWDWQKQLLYWVDIEGCKLHAHNPSNGKNRHWSFDKMLGAAVPIEHGNILLALESGLATFDFEKDVLTEHKVLENTDSEMRYNDGKVSPKGNFWIGSMHKKFQPRTGNLYRVTHNFRANIQISGTTISNGMAWTSDNSKFYFIDSPTFEVKVFDYSMENDSISNGKVAIKIPQEYGSPDGMCMDAEEMLWIAHWGGSCIRKWNPETGEVIEQVDVAAPHVTSCCFGGKNLDTLYITTARSGLSKVQLEEFPLSGGLFHFSPNVKGQPITYFKE